MVASLKGRVSSNWVRRDRGKQSGGNNTTEMMIRITMVFRVNESQWVEGVVAVVHCHLHIYL